MKKGICMFLSGLLILTLAACGGENHSSSVEEDTTSSVESSASAGGNGSTGPSEGALSEPEDDTVPEQEPPAGESQSPEESSGSALQDTPSMPENGGNIPGERHEPTQEHTTPVPDSARPTGETASSAQEGETAPPTQEGETALPEELEEEDSMNADMFYVTVGGTAFAATFAENAGAQALKELLADGPVTISMSDYGSFEKVGPLGQSLPTSNSQTTTQAGDIVLYQGNQIVMFYGSNSWSYTRLGKINDLTGWEEALGSGDVSVTFSLTA